MFSFSCLIRFIRALRYSFLMSENIVPAEVQTSDSESKSLKEFFQQPVNVSSLLLIAGSFLFMIIGVLIFYDEYMIYWSRYGVYIGYLLYLILTVSLIPIAFGIGKITADYGEDHIIVVGKQAKRWLLIFTILTIVNFFTLGWPMIAPYALIATAFGRVIGFYKLNKALLKIKRLWKINVGSIIYYLYAFYAIVMSVLANVAELASDADFVDSLFYFNGIGNTFLLLLVGIKLITDTLIIRSFIIKQNIQLFTLADSWVVRYRKDIAEQKWKERQSSVSLLDRLKEKQEEDNVPSAAVLEEKYKVEKAKKEKIVTEAVKVGAFKEAAKPEPLPKIKDIPVISVGKMYHEKPVKKKFTSEKIIQQVLLYASLIAFIIVSVLSENITLKIFGYVGIGLISAFLITNYILLFFLEQGFNFTNLLIDLSFMFILLPSVFALISYGIAWGADRAINDMSPLAFKLIIAICTILMELVAVYVLINIKLEQTKMTLKEFIKYRLDFKTLSLEQKKIDETVAKKRSYFEKLDKLESHMAKQRAEKVMNYEDFDVKKRLKELGGIYNVLQAEKKEEEQEEEQAEKKEE